MKSSVFWSLLQIGVCGACVVCVLGLKEPWAFPLLTYAFPMWVLVSIRVRMDGPTGE